MSTLTSDGLQTLLNGLGIDQPLPTYPAANIQNNPLGIYSSYLAQAIVQATSCEPDVALDAIQLASEPGMGHLAIIIPRLRLQDTDPDAVVEQLSGPLSALLPLIGVPITDGVHQRMFFHPITLARILLPYVLDRGSSYGIDQQAGPEVKVSPEQAKKKVIVEFSSPNLGKEFDGNHLRSTIAGACISALYQRSGWDVCRMNFLGDWGKHIGLLGVGWAKYGSEEAFEADSLGHLLEVFTKINQLLKFVQESHDKPQEEGQEPVTNGIPGVDDEKDAFFRRMEDGDPDALALWKRFREASIAKYTELYARLNIHFDEYSGESQVGQETIAEVEATLQSRGIFEDSQGARVIDFNKLGCKGLGTGMLRYRNGTTSYLLRDIAAVLERSQKHQFDKMVYVVTSKQDNHFRQLFKALELMGHSELTAKLQHIGFKPVQGLSPREGSPGLLLSDILDDCRDVIHRLFEADPESVADLLSPTGDHALNTDKLAGLALMTQELSGRRGTAFAYDLAKMGTVEGHTGLYLQLWLSRLDSRLNGVAAIDHVALQAATERDFSVFDQEEYGDVLHHLLLFPALAKSSFRTLESSAVLVYLFRLVDLLYRILQDVAGEDDANEAGEGSSHQNVAKLALLQCVRQVLKNGLGMVALDVSLDVNVTQAVDVMSGITAADTAPLTSVDTVVDAPATTNDIPDTHGDAATNENTIADIDAMTTGVIATNTDATMDSNAISDAPTTTNDSPTDDADAAVNNNAAANTDATTKGETALDADTTTNNPIADDADAVTDDNTTANTDAARNGTAVVDAPITTNGEAAADAPATTGSVTADDVDAAVNDNAVADTEATTNGETVVDADTITGAITAADPDVTAYGNNTGNAPTIANGITAANAEAATNSNIVTDTGTTTNSTPAAVAETDTTTTGPTAVDTDKTSDGSTVVDPSNTNVDRITSADPDTMTNGDTAVDTAKITDIVTAGDAETDATTGTTAIDISAETDKLTGSATAGDAGATTNGVAGADNATEHPITIDASPNVAQAVVA